MTHAAPDKKVLSLRCLGAVDAFGAPDLLDHIAQCRVHQALVQLAAAHGPRQRDLADFTQQAGAEAKRRADHAFRKRQQVRLRRHGSTLQGHLPGWWVSGLNASDHGRYARWHAAFTGAPTSLGLGRKSSHSPDATIASTAT